MGGGADDPGPRPNGGAHLEVYDDVGEESCLAGRKWNMCCEWLQSPREGTSGHGILLKAWSWMTWQIDAWRTSEDSEASEWVNEEEPFKQQSPLRSSSSRCDTVRRLQVLAQAYTTPPVPTTTISVIATTTLTIVIITLINITAIDKVNNHAAIWQSIYHVGLEGHTFPQVKRGNIREEQKKQQKSKNNKKLSSS